MGVPGFWDHMVKYSQRVDISELDGKTLAIDGHSWMLESPNVKGLKNSKHAFLVTFYKRCICLRQNNIEPFVVFDKIPTMFDQHLFSEPGVKIMQKKRTKRGGTNGWNSTIYQDLTARVTLVKELLTGMGIRYVEGGADGDAQCAQLEEIGVADGCITSDMDYFLFGGQHMYKIDFNQTGIATIQHLSMPKLESLNLNRNRLIALAMLLGCDYVEGGLERVGIISALEILSEFAFHEDDHPISILDRFAGYIRGELPIRSTDSDRKQRLRTSPPTLPHGFPNTDVYVDASCLYLVPRVEPLDQEGLPGKNEIDWKRVSTFLHTTTGYTPPKPASFRSSPKKQPTIPQFFSTTRRRSAPVIENCSAEDRHKCSQREWAALEKLKDSDSQYTIGIKRKHDDNSEESTSAKGTSPKLRSKKALITDASTQGTPRVEVATMTETQAQSESSSVICLE